MRRTLITLVACALAGACFGEPGGRVRRTTCEPDPKECTTYEDRSLCQHALVGGIVRDLCPIFCGLCELESPASQTSTATSTATTTATSTAPTTAPTQVFCSEKDKDVCSDPGEFNSDKAYCTHAL
eukprot:gene23894-20748_t